jgi:hypothetical protein
VYVDEVATGFEIIAVLMTLGVGENG